jgi:hypothetical protein
MMASLIMFVCEEVVQQVVHAYETPDENKNKDTYGHGHLLFWGL